MYFAEKGRVLTQAEYIDAPDKPISFHGIRNVFRAYSRAILMLERNEPELWKMIYTPKKQAEPKPIIAPKPTIVVPPAKVVEKREDGKDI
jgi:hypothetical protein